MIKLIFCLAFVSVVFGTEFSLFVKSVGNDKEYFISKDKLTFGQAYASCKVNGWTLALEQKPEDTKIVNDALLNSGRTEKDFWIGGYLYDDNDLEPLWIWLDVGDVMEYTNWEGEQPNDTRHCVLKTTEGDVSGKWKAAACLEKHQYICLVL